MPIAEKEAVERLDLSPDSPWWGEHRSRYHFASDLSRDAHVLDIACGTGFGGEILLDHGAASVTGVDIERDALLRAKAKAPARQHVVQADGTRLPFVTDSFDTVVSFETLEHIEDASGLIAELGRVLRPHGTLMLSTPNALHTRPVDGRPRNPFHVKEYLPSELSRLLSSHFQSVTLLGQRTHPRYSVSPFWELPENLPEDLPGGLRVLSWKIQNRLPFRLKDAISRSLHHRSFFPGEHDFVFEEEAVDRGHVLVAVCRS